MNDLSPLERQIKNALAIGFRREKSADWALYERLKAEATAALPDLSPEQYTRLMRAIAKAAGV